MCVNTRDKEGRKNNVRESYGDRTLVVKGRTLSPPLEEVWNSLEGEGLTALVNIIRKYDYETRFLCGRGRVTRHFYPPSGCHSREEKP